MVYASKYYESCSDQEGVIVTYSVKQFLSRTHEYTNSTEQHAVHDSKTHAFKGEYIIICLYIPPKS